MRASEPRARSEAPRNSANRLAAQRSLGCTGDDCSIRHNRIIGKRDTGRDLGAVAYSDAVADRDSGSDGCAVANPRAVLQDRMVPDRDTIADVDVGGEFSLRSGGARVPTGVAPRCPECLSAGARR